MNQDERYKRQILLREIGVTGQERLQKAGVLVIGAGGLGCPALQYLAAAGVGRIGIIDHDHVELSNLQRQILFSTNDPGKNKSVLAASRLREANPDIHVTSFTQRVDNSNALELFENFDIIIDGSDNFETRYCVNDACRILDKPLIYGAVLRFEGQVGVFHFPDPVSGIRTDYRDLFPAPPDPDKYQSCNDVGVLGVVPGIIGTMQAAEAIKIITGAGSVLAGQLLSFSLLTNTFYKFSIGHNAENVSAAPANKSAFSKFDYAWFCRNENNVSEISLDEFKNLMHSGKVNIIDVREKNELPAVTEFAHLQYPLSDFENKINGMKIDGTVVVFCRTGIRSATAARILKNKFPEASIFSLDGGIEAWHSNS